MNGPPLEPAFVLHTRRYGDSSLLVELLMREQGRMACIAKGALRARRPDTRLQPFQPLLVSLRGRGEVSTLTRAEPAGSVYALQGRRLYCGLYLNELMMRLTPRQDPHAGLFDDYAAAIGTLAGTAAAEPVLRRFEVQLFDHLGLGLSLQTDDRGQPVRPDSRYTYAAADGPTLAPAGSPDAVTGATLLALHAGHFDDEHVLREARRLMRRIINHYLEGRPLKSRELFR